jgi:hypothetical protein
MESRIRSSTSREQLLMVILKKTVSNLIGELSPQVNNFGDSNTSNFCYASYFEVSSVTGILSGVSMSRGVLIIS